MTEINCTYCKEKMAVGDDVSGWYEVKTDASFMGIPEHHATVDTTECLAAVVTNAVQQKDVAKVLILVH